uniref:MELPH protein n=1 Tax=Macrostomum lignano TaxID=282301 RepID=A0A1I8GZJ8_9PLAT
MHQSEQNQLTASQLGEFDQQSTKSSLNRPKSIRYTGDSIPSKTFRLLCNAVPGEAPMQPLRMPRSRARALQEQQQQQQVEPAREEESSSVCSEAAEVEASLGCPETVGVQDGTMQDVSAKSAPMTRWQSRSQHLDTEDASGEDELLNNAIFQRLQRRNQDQEQLDEDSDTAELHRQQFEQTEPKLVREELATSSSRIQELREIQQTRRKMR